ncbi:MAG: RNA methyltransferase [Candidatus Nanopelagicales bacterium]
MAGPEPELTSTRSDRVVRVRRLATRAFREKTGEFVVEGPQAVREALAVAGCVRELYVTPEAADRHADLVAAAHGDGALVMTAAPEVLARMADTVHPQGLVGVAARVDVPLDRALATGPDGSPPRLVAVLVDARDPGNAGTVLRTADAAGADAVLLAGDSVDPHNGKCVRATAGSLFHLPVATAGSLAEVVAALRAAGLLVLAADGAGDVDLDRAADDGLLDRPTAWLFGNEARGLSAEQAALADAVVRVPLHGRAESLNLAAAAAVCLYASARAHRPVAGRTD